MSNAGRGRVGQQDAAGLEVAGLARAVLRGRAADAVGVHASPLGKSHAVFMIFCTLYQSQPLVKRAAAELPVRQLNLWHMPFCRGCDPEFLSALTREQIGRAHV